MTAPLNFIVVSPHFPPNFEPFTLRLHETGFRTLGIGDCPYDQLSPSLKTALTEYYRVDDMEDYNQMYKAVAYFAFKYGKIDRLESHNEYWLLQDAKLRTDFNIPGYKNADVDVIKYKSKMKEVFVKNGIPAAKGQLVKDKEQTEQFVSQVGYPVIIKPDSGVGASDTYKVNNQAELESFFTKKRPGVAYFLEEYLEGEIVTFDGLTDQDGKVVFYSSMVYGQPALETVLDACNMYFYEAREIPADLKKLGLKSVAAFKITERFFHFEFFRTKDKKLYALELNCRPPGGPSIDLMNHAHQIDLFKAYAVLVKENHFIYGNDCPYNSVYVSRRKGPEYLHSVADVKTKYAAELKDYQEVPAGFADIMGDIGFIFNTKTVEQLKEISAYVHASKQ